MADQRPLGFWLKLVDSLITIQFNESMEEHGVTRRQWQIMNLLADGPLPEDELLRRLSPFNDHNNDGVQDELDELADSGWLARDEGDYFLTPVGRTSLTTLTEVVDANRDAIAQGITEEEFQTTLDVLERMARNLGWNEQA